MLCYLYIVVYSTGTRTRTGIIWNGGVCFYAIIIYNNKYTNTGNTRIYRTRNTNNNNNTITVLLRVRYINTSRLVLSTARYTMSSLSMLD